MMEEAQDKGIPGVPFTVINQKWAIAGGQTAEVYYSVRFFFVGRARMRKTVADCLDAM